MLVGHVEAHEPQRILRTGVLAEAKLGAIGLAPIDGDGIDLLAVVGAGEDADLLLLQVLRLLDEARDQIERGDAFRHAPVGEEVERLDGGAHRGRLALGLAGDHAMPQLHLMPLHGLELVGRHVDQDVALLDPLPHQVAQSRHVGAQLRQAGLGRDVQRLQRGLVDASGDAQPVVELEAAHGGLEVLAVAEAERVGLAARAARR